LPTFEKKYSNLMKNMLFLSQKAWILTLNTVKSFNFYDLKVWNTKFEGANFILFFLGK